MKTLNFRFLLPFGLAAVLFSALVLYRAYTMSQRHAHELLSQQAALALEFNLAIRDYAAEQIRPVMERLVDKDEFLPETMSTSFISRRIFEMVRKKFPDCVIRFASFMRHLPGFAFVKDHDRRVLYVNELFETAFGLALPEWRGKTNDEIWPGEVGEKIRRDDEAVLAVGEPRALIEDVPTHGELRTYRTIKFPIPQPDGRPWLGGISVDITELRRAEQEKEKLQAQLAQSQKMESVGRLAGGVAHDFNNMLQAILGNAALALEDLPPESPLRESLEEIQKSAQRSADLTCQLLAFARKQTIQPRVLDLNDTVAGMLKMLRRLIGEDLHLAWLPGADLWPVKVDPSQIDQILANLCVNARDAIAGTGKVTIETANVTFDDTYATSHPECVPGDYVLLAVSDTGQGMDEEARAHLFEPFFTTDVVMPGMNGKELRERLRTSHPELKCLFMSGYTANVIAHHGILDEGVDFLQKPFTIQTLAEKIREVLEQTMEP